jgi:K+ transporter
VTPLTLPDRVVAARFGRVTVVWFGVLAALGGGSAMGLVLACMVQAGLEPLRFAWVLFVLIPLAAVL